RTCTAVVGGVTEIKNLQYAAKTVRLTDNSQAETVTIMGPFEIRLDGPTANTGTGNKQLSFRFTDRSRNALIIQADKRGTSGGVAGNFTSFRTEFRNTVNQNVWYPMTDGSMQPNIGNYDPVFFWFFDLTEGSIYRVSVAAVRGAAIGEATGIISVFIEKLEGTTLQ
ncbi:MAG: hypothetical protein Q4F57_10330, partial [Weeksellaceae bacterium]|nr:hypothetical protein [Weeksellaceae bacterium]